MYEWRKMTPRQRAEVLELRQGHQQPWHSPSHRESGTGQYLITAACFEHRPVIGHSPVRLAALAASLMEMFRQCETVVYAWVVLPNHYHVLADAPDVCGLLKQVGLLHGRTSHQWNGEEDCRGRQVWCKAAETAIKSERHFWAALNYVHHNPVRHGYVETWQAWPFSSAADYLQTVGQDKAKQVWTEYPVLDFGKDWDPPNR